MPKFDAAAPVTAENLRKAGFVYIDDSHSKWSTFMDRRVDVCGVPGNSPRVAMHGTPDEDRGHLEELCWLAMFPRNMGEVASLCWMFLGIDIAEAANGD